MNTYPTPYADVNSVLLELLTGVQNILGPHFVGMYLYGSLANGDFDQDSDVDFVAPAGTTISGAGPIAVMRSSRIRTVALRIGSAPVPEITVTFRMASTPRVWPAVI